MSSFNIADVTDFLTSGAVFTREDGRESRVLFVTNTALPEKLKAKYPPQVVYADESDNILSCSIERFLQNRTFYNVQPELEARLTELLAAPSTAVSEDILDLMSEDDDDGDALRADDSEDLVLQIDGEEDIDTHEPIVEFTLRHGDTELPSIFDLDHLTAAVASYQQQPAADLNAVQHVLFIKAEAGITDASLRAVFSPANEALNHTLEFAVDTEGLGEMRLINWDTFIGVYPCVFYGSRMYQVVFGASALNVAPEVIEEIASNAADQIAALGDNAVTETVITPAPVAVKVTPMVAEGESIPVSAGSSGGSGGGNTPAAGQIVQVKIEVAPPAPASSEPSTAMAQALAAAKPQA